MAHMIPATPKEFDERSHEGDVFNALKKLPDDYYVFHSVSTVGVTDDNVFYERELDFVVASPKKGILAIEVKAGNNIHFVERTWRYSSGRVMSHGGPYNQAATAKRALSNKFTSHSDERIRELYKKTKFMHAVFFPEMTQEKMEAMQGLPEDADIRITLCADDLVNPTKKIAEMFSVTIPAVRTNTDETRISDEDFQLILDEVLCPHFNLIPSPQAKTIAINERMNQLLREQYLVLDFLEEQESAVINGAAGTGKTMVAVEKARRHSVNGDKVLFLCYNRMLCEKLIEDHKNNESKAYRKQFENVDFMTISRLAKKATGDFRNYDCLYEWLLECIDKKHELGYKHIIVDEGQDFGLVDSDLSEEHGTSSENTSIIDALQEAAIENGGTFYLFYDKYQMIQGGGSVEYELPYCIENSDCRLTLHKNCRNTKEIARTSVTPLRDKKNKAIKANVSCSWEEHIKPVFHIVDEADAIKCSLDQALSKLEELEVKDVIILTPGTFEHSAVYPELRFSADQQDGYAYYLHGDKEYKVTTCIRFKGLEADAIVMIDLNKDSFVGQKGLEFYVGTSRAKHFLDLICNVAGEDYYEIAHSLDPNAPKRDDPIRMKRILADIFAATME